MAGCAGEEQVQGHGRSCRPHPLQVTSTLPQLPVHLIVRALEFCGAASLARFEAVGTDASRAVRRALALCAGRLHSGATSLPARLPAASSCPYVPAAHAHGHQQLMFPGVLRTRALYTLEQQAHWRGRISAGAHHSAFVRYNDTFTWGDGKAGRLGQGDERSWQRPTRVYRYDARQFDPALSAQAPGHRIRICGVACGDHHTLMLTGDGHVYGCGSNGSGQLGIGARRRNGGDGGDGGDRANATFASRECCPVRVSEVRVYTHSVCESDSLEKAPLFNYVAAGATSSVMLCGQGGAFVCGTGNCSGLGTERTQVYPRRICLPSTRMICAGPADAEHGKDVNGMTAHASRAATDTDAEAGPGARADAVVAVSIGQVHMLLLCRSGVVFACGVGTFGQLGLGNRRPSHQPSQVVGLPPSRSVAAGASHSVAVTRNGSCYTWGYSTHGALGHGTDTSAHQGIVQPLLVEEMLGRVAAECVAGQHHTVFLCADGAVFSCGQGWQGRLGLGDELDRATPHEVRALRGHPIAAVAANKSHTLFVTTRGAVFATGEGWKGRLGLGLDMSTRVLPAVVMGADGSVVRNNREQLHSWKRGIENSLRLLA